MSLARDLVEVEANLRDSADIDLFSSTGRSRLAADPRCADLAGRIVPLVTGDPSAALRLCLQALRVQHDEMRPKLVDAELVATLPPETPGIARPTERVVREMLEGATKEVILLGYELTDRGLVQLLAEIAAREVEIIIICDRGRGSANTIRDAWPSGKCSARIYHDRDRPEKARYASMHAKCLLIDGADLLVTSANFTFHGMQGNIEIGIRVSGAPASEARKIFSHLVEARLVEELDTRSR